MAAAGFPLPLSADLEDLASAVTPVHADHHPTGSGSSLRNWAEITSHTCGEASKEDHSVTARPTAPLIIAFITGRPAGPGAANQDHRQPVQAELSGAGPPQRGLVGLGQRSISHSRWFRVPAGAIAADQPEPSWP